MNRRFLLVMLGLAGFALLPGCGMLGGKRSPDAAATSIGYVPEVGDIVFQSMPPNELATAIETATESPYSHCGVVARKGNQWVVIEAVGPVCETPLESFIRRGQQRQVAAYRLKAEFRERIPEFIAACRLRLGVPYDTRYRMDDEAIYCSELVYKSFEQATGEKLGELVTLGSLNWRPVEATIRKYEGGEPPLDRLMITPRDLAQAGQLAVVFSNGI
jgi:hypothetical protein